MIFCRIKRNISIRASFYTLITFNTFIHIYLHKRRLNFCIKPEDSYYWKIKRQNITSMYESFFFGQKIFTRVFCQFFCINVFRFNHLWRMTENHIIRHYITLLLDKMIAFAFQFTNNHLGSKIIYS